MPCLPRFAREWARRFISLVWRAGWINSQDMNHAIVAATQGEAKALLDKINTASAEEQRLRKLREHQQQLSIPEQEKLDHLKLELEKLNAQRRELEGRRRQQGEAIHTRLFLINLLTMPLLIALFTLISSLIHRRRIRSR